MPQIHQSVGQTQEVSCFRICPIKALLVVLLYSVCTGQFSRGGSEMDLAMGFLPPEKNERLTIDSSHTPASSSYTWSPLTTLEPNILFISFSEFRNLERGGPQGFSSSASTVNSPPVHLEKGAVLSGRCPGTCRSLALLPRLLPPPSVSPSSLFTSLTAASISSPLSCRDHHTPTLGSDRNEVLYTPISLLLHAQFTLASYPGPPCERRGPGIRYESHAGTQYGDRLVLCRCVGEAGGVERSAVVHGIMGAGSIIVALLDVV